MSVSVENILWQLENEFKCNKVKSEKEKDLHCGVVRVRDGHVMVEVKCVKNREGVLHYQHMGQILSGFKEGFLSEQRHL